MSILFCRTQWKLEVSLCPFCPLLPTGGPLGNGDPDPYPGLSLVWGGRVGAADGLESHGLGQQPEAQPEDPCGLVRTSSPTRTACLAANS